MKTSDPPRWEALVRIAVQKHQGVLRRAANDLDIGYSTLKRWISESAELKKHVVQARRRVRRRTAA